MTKYFKEIDQVKQTNVTFSCEQTTRNLRVTLSISSCLISMQELPWKWRQKSAVSQWTNLECKQQLTVTTRVIATHSAQVNALNYLQMCSCMQSNDLLYILRSSFLTWVTLWTTNTSSSCLTMLYNVLILMYCAKFLRLILNC